MKLKAHYSGRDTADVQKVVSLPGLDRTKSYQRDSGGGGGSA